MPEVEKAELLPSIVCGHCEVHIFLWGVNFHIWFPRPLNQQICFNDSYSHLLLAQPRADHGKESQNNILRSIPVTCLWVRLPEIPSRGSSGGRTGPDVRPQPPGRQRAAAVARAPA